jgi:hypothetical protein
VLLDARIQLPRTDDYGRTFQRLRYRFNRELSAKDTYLLKKHPTQFDRVVAWGNADGLIEEKRISGTIGKDDLLVPPTELTGPGPWWIAFPGRERTATSKSWGIGYISFVIRSYKASFGGKTVRTPTFRVRVAERKGTEAKLETWLVPPRGVETYKPGDWVILDTEWLHLHRNADDYCGPNAAYRRHLEENPQSWKTTWREARGNDLKVEVDGGTLLQRLPIVVRADKPEVRVTIRGGVGQVPIRFEGLASADGYGLYELLEYSIARLDQSVHGNDFWQTEYDAGSGSFSMSFNLPVDGKASSEWTLKQKPDTKHQ